MDITPNIRRLIVHRMALQAVPPGGGFLDGMKFLLSPDLGQEYKKAAKWVEEALAIVKTAPDNPYDDDEAIAGELLKRLASTR